ncbi:ATP-binding protein [Umezawaea beigongshangensis]|uniref:ATP-binding protein n=1 Tax=Umezawaea beigongshangensis TaxID=2780383 RepID=UPI0018F19F99|nr:ATP-binding protein [Umezawaea beigongshangensis]
MTSTITSSTGTLLAGRLRETRARAFAGRSGELAVFRAALRGDPGSSPVLFVHGPGGIGKSTLLRRFADEAEAAGRTVTHICARSTPATPAAFEAAAAPVLADETPVLLIDAFERCRGLELWLRRRLLPRLPDRAVVVVADLEPPSLEWRTDPGWEDALGVIALRNLSPEEASALLTSRGVDPARHDELLRFAGGHPLALRLAAETTSDAGPGPAPARDVVTTLLERLVGDVPSQAHRRALEVCAHSLVTTELLLRAVLPDDDAAELFAWLRRLPFVESGARGVFPHDVVRDALEADLRWRDMASWEEVHRRIREHLIGRCLQAPEPEALALLSETTYLHRYGGVTHDYFSFREDGATFEDVLRPEDHGAVLRLAAGTCDLALVAHWLDRWPEAFRVHRSSGTGEPVAFMTWLLDEEPDAADLAADPVLAAAWAYARASTPPRPGERLGLMRFLVCPDGDVRPSPVLDRMLWRIAACWMRTDRLAWSVMATPHPRFWERLMIYLDHPPLPETAAAGEHAQTLYVHDWRTSPLRVWLTNAAVEEVYGPGARPPATPELAVLSRAEFDEAVRDALRCADDPVRLARNPLSRSNLVAAHDTTLRRVLVETVNALRVGRHHVAVSATYLGGPTTQEACAQRLRLPLGTYRRHLTRGVAALCDALWEREVLR